MQYDSEKNQNVLRNMARGVPRFPKNILEKINTFMKIREITETMTAGSVATVVQPIANDVQRVAQRPKKPKKTKWAHKKPGPKKENTIIRR
jgi:hypothetical protein